MAKAGTVPSTYECRHFIGPHVLTNFRERSAEGVRSLDDWALRNLIDRRICDWTRDSGGMPTPVYELKDGKAVATYIVPIGDEIFALMRKNQYASKTRHEYAVVTVYKKAWIDSKLSSGDWRKNASDFLSTFGNTSLADQLTAAGIEPVKSAPPDMAVSESISVGPSELSHTGNFAVALRAARAAAGLSQSDLASRAGVSPYSIKNWEAGKAPNERSISALCSALPSLCAALSVPPTTCEPKTPKRVRLADKRPRQIRATPSTTSSLLVSWSDNEIIRCERVSESDLGALLIRLAGTTVDPTTIEVWDRRPGAARVSIQYG
jgi:transcriptional regulator with XRE-family HTH domain